MARKSAQTPIPDLLEGYKPDDPASLLAVEDKVRSYLKLFYLKMNRAQIPFIRIKNNRGRIPRTRLFESGNQVGKCVSASTLIETPKGIVTAGWLYKRSLPFDVYAWDGEKRVVARASAPFKKPGLHQCYRITMSDGRWVEAADHHRILCDDGEYRTVVQLHDAFQLRCLRTSASSLRLREGFAFPQVSSSEPGLSVCASGEICFPRTPSSFLESCSLYLRRRGERPLNGRVAGQSWIPSPGDAQPHIAFRIQHSGERDSTRTDTPCELSRRPASWYDLRQIAGQFAEFSSRAAARLSQWLQSNNQSRLQLSTVAGSRLQSCVESSPHRRSSNSAVASSHPPVIGNYIESITPITILQEVFDFEVLVYRNYFAGGLIHHNTSIGVAEDIAHAMGFRPWLEQSDPDYKINVRVPNNGLVGCEVAGQTLAQRIEPEFMSLIPQYCGVTTSRYSDGSIKSLTLTNDFNGKPCGSTIHFRSYVQPAESYEGVVLDWIHFDEPPPQDILNAATRGLMSTNGPSWYTMTPLKEAYIYDLLSLHAANNGGTDQEIAVFRGSTWDNCQDWCRACDCTVPENDPERLAPGQVRPVDNCPKCGQVMGFLPRAGIENYLKKITDPDEREAREEGKWKHLSGLVYKELDRDKHLYDDFTIPSDWMRIEVLDPHDARPCCWLFGAVSPEEINVNGREANRIYWYDYLRPSGNIEAIARQVKVKRAYHNYRDPAMLIIDVKFAAALKPLHGEEQPSWEEELEKAGMKKIVHSCSAPGDVMLGHKRVKEYLGPHYSVVRGKEFPGMLFARQGTHGDGGPMQHMSNYSWREGTDKPNEAYKDFCDCVRYAALEQPVYRSPEPEIDPDLARLLLANQNDRSQSTNPLYHGLSVR